MQLTDDFTVAVARDQLWDVLTDVERIAPCVPGFTLQRAEHPEYAGVMKVKVGAIIVSYDATITFVERDDEAKRVVLAIKGKELRGAGSVDATVTSSLVGAGDAETRAEMVTDVQITGRVAQFGRGIIADVSSRMTEQFVERLNREVMAAPAPAAAAASNGAAAPSPPSVSEDDAVDLGAVAAVPVLKRVAPLVVALGLLYVVVRAGARLRR